MPIRSYTMQLFFIAIFLGTAVTSPTKADTVKRNQEDANYSVADFSVPCSFRGREVNIHGYQVRNRPIWVCIGYPYAIDLWGTQESMRLSISVLDDKQLTALKRAAQAKYPGQTITNNRFSIVPLQQVICKVNFTHDDKEYFLSGDSSDFRTREPDMITIDLPYNAQSDQRKALEAGMYSRDKLIWKCTFLAAGKVLRNNVLKIEASEITEIMQEADLFGNANEVYVSHSQINLLSQVVRVKLRISEDYNINGEVFDCQFIDQLLRMTPGEQVSIDEYLEKFSRFGATLDEKDASPDIIKSMSDSLEVKSDGKKNWIAAKNKTATEGGNKDETMSDVKAKYGINFPGIVLAHNDIAVKTANEHSEDWKNQDISEIEQVQIINDASRYQIQYQIHGSLIIPYSISVSKLGKASIRNDFVISHTKIKVLNAEFKKEFVIETSAADLMTNAPPVICSTPTTATSPKVKI